jgi:hypothetical protein
VAESLELSAHGGRGALRPSAGGAVGSGALFAASVTFVSNDRLLEMMSRTSATPEQVEAALQINADARLRALKLTLLLLTGLGLLAFVPAGRLPGRKPGDVSG